MELSFLLKAIRRYWYIFVSCVLVGAIPGLTELSNNETLYESTAIIMVSPPSESRVQLSVTSDADRYVLGQLAVLRSESMAANVASIVGQGESTISIQGVVAVEHEAGTDIVEIIAKTDSPDRSRQIADTFVDLYFDLLNEQVQDSRQPEIAALDVQLADVEAELGTVDESIRSQMQPFLPVAGATAQDVYAPIPQIEQVVPELVSRKALLLSQYNQLLTSRTQLLELEVNAKLRVTSEVVQLASLPELPEPSEGRLILAAGLLGGAFVGLVACVIAARLSRTAVDQDQIAEVLGTPIIGEFPRSRQIHKNRRASAEQLPHRLVPFVDALAVQAEAAASVGKTLTVAVVGTERSAGATSLASALANRYAVNGSQVLLVDVDLRDSELTRLFAAGSPGIPGLLAMSAVDADGSTRRHLSNHLDPFSSTALPGLVVVGVGDKSGGGLRRQIVPELIQAASRHAHVVIFDGGPLLDSASTVQLAQLVDAVVLAVPMRRVARRSLFTIASQLQGRRGELFPVFVPSVRRRGSEPVEPDRSRGAAVVSEPRVFDAPTADSR